MPTFPGPNILRKFTNKVVCAHCKKEIDYANEYYYAIHLEKDFLLASTKESKYEAGCGAILRYYEKCWRFLCGGTMCFDKRKYK